MPPDWNISEVRWPHSVAAAVHAWCAGSELAWLDGRPHGTAPAWGGHSLICTRPVGFLQQSSVGPAVLRFEAGGDPRTAANGWDLWRQANDLLGVVPAGEPSLPLRPGWVGYIGFEMAGRLERLPHARAAPLDLPALRLSLYDRGIVLDHAARRAYAVRARLHSALGVDVDPDWRTRWEQAACACVAPVAPPQNIEEQQPERAAYEGAVQRALKYIAAGDIYQVNLARCVRLSITADALALYERVRAANPAPYAALLRWQGGAVASVSPELFLRVCGREVLTSPIKGTRPRTGHPAPDAARREELWHSAKERAELAMIVDLHRNDLGRVCEPGSVVVRCARRLEAHPTVMHTVADVAGRLAPERDGLDLLRACFPAGSISGVPKIRALQIIHALEPVGRGAYTGAIGVLSLSGDMFWNVAIRTLQIQPPAATLYVGGGIVADSDPAAEYLETCAKAAGILGGIRGTAPSAARAW